MVVGDISLGHILKRNNIMKNLALAIVSTLWFIFSALISPVLYKYYKTITGIEGDALTGVLLMAFILYLLSFFLMAYRWVIVFDKSMEIK
jgi:hypothetical protein